MERTNIIYTVAGIVILTGFSGVSYWLGKRNSSSNIQSNITNTPQPQSGTEFNQS